MVRRRRDVSTWPVMASCCSSCPFSDGGDAQIRARVQLSVLSEASQICHHPRLSSRPETHLCRGARDFQLQVFHRIGFLEEPTDAAWEAKLKEVRR